MSFPSKFPGRCSRCGQAFPAGAAIEYDRATKAAWHAGCPIQAEMPQEGREPEERAGGMATATKARRRASSVPARPSQAAIAHVACHRCGGSSIAGRPMIHVDCIDQDDVPF